VGPIVVDDWDATNIEGVDLALDRLERWRYFPDATDVQVNDFDAERVRRCLNLTHLKQSAGITYLGHDRQSAQTRHYRAQKLNSFPDEIRRLNRQTGDVSTRSRKICDKATAGIGCRNDDRDGGRRSL
jgi:hypothetical protein